METGVLNVDMGTTAKCKLRGSVYKQDDMQKHHISIMKTNLLCLIIVLTQFVHFGILM